MTTFPNPTNLKLSGVESLCMAIQSNPGQSKRYYLRRKNIYQRGSDYSNGGNGMMGYFSPGCFYDYNLWYDVAPREVRRRNWMGRIQKHPKSSQMQLTHAGWNRANDARKKLGLEPLPHND